MATPRLRRVEAMLGQLDKASKEYLMAKEEFDAARVAYEVAREKFSGVRRLAMDVLGKNDWWHWRFAHPSVQYVGMRIGEAIYGALENHAFEAANTYWQSEGRSGYFPAVELEPLQEAMERGGFEFRSTSPLREVNAALINLDGVVRQSHGCYQVADAEKILEVCKPEEDEESKSADDDTAA